MISPEVLLLHALFNRTDRILPPIHISQPIAVYKASTGESNESRLHVCQCLCEIRPKSVCSVFKCVLREKRDHIHGHLTFRSCQNHKGNCIMTCCCREVCGVFFPIGGRC